MVTCKFITNIIMLNVNIFYLCIYKLIFYSSNGTLIVFFEDNQR